MIKDVYYFDETLFGPRVLGQGDNRGVVVVGGCHHVAVEVNNNICCNTTRHL